VQGIHLEITQSIKEYCETKINKAVSHFDLHDVREVDVRCSARGGEKTAGRRRAQDHRVGVHQKRRGAQRRGSG
jgi:ribosome-associated translation inhibitor RaiA